MYPGTHLRSFFIILIVSIFTLFLHNGVLPANLMEARNLATAQEMVREGNYLVPTMNGELRLEKPPLPTWISAVVEQCCPEDLAAQRRVTAAVTFFMAFVLYLLVLRFTGERNLSLMAALVLVTSYNIIMNGRTATWDIYCHAFMLAALYNLFCALSSRTSSWGRFLAAGFWMGLSFLGKGPVAFYALLLPALIGHYLIFRPRLNGKAAPLAVMVLICLLIACWWPVWIALSHADAGTAAVAKESAAWMNRNVRPFWYYWHFTDESGIWALCWVSSIVFFFADRRPQHRQFNGFIICWNLLILLFLSLVPEKKTRYLLPVLIPGAVSIAFYFWHSIRSVTSGWEKHLFRFNGWIMIVVATVLPAALYVAFVRQGALPWPVFVAVTLVCWGNAVYMFRGVYRFRTVRSQRIFTGAVLVMTLFTATCFEPAGRLFLNEARHSIRLLKTVPEAADLPFYHPQEEPLRMELVYEANRTILPVNVQDSAVLASRIPFVLVSMQDARELLREQNVTVEYIDTYDNNWRKADAKRYNEELVLQAAVVRAAEPLLLPDSDEDVPQIDHQSAPLSQNENGVVSQDGINHNEQ